MTAKSITEEITPEQVVDDISTAEVSEPASVDAGKLAALKAQSQAKQMEQRMSAKIVAKKERSLNLGVVGSGQAGSRIAEAFYKMGYDVVVCNTANQDLKFIAVPDSNKLLLEYGIGGSGKDIEFGAAAAQSHRGEITQLINDKLLTSQVNVLCLSLGGGSGAGSCQTLVEVLTETGKPLVVLTVLPMDTDDTQTKSNALETLSKLAKMAQEKKISNLVVVDNAKIEAIYSGIGQMEFFQVANKAIVEPLDIFNTLSAMPSPVKAMDSMEWAKALCDGEGLSVYGELTVADYKEDTAIAKAVIDNLNGNLLAGGFDLKQAKYVGVMIVANAKVWKEIPSSSVNYAMALVNDFCSSPRGVFRGIYEVDTPDNVVKVYSIFSGLGLPASRVDQLKKDAQSHMQATKGKEEHRNLSLTLETGTNDSVSAAQRVKDQIAKKSSQFGKLTQNSIQDRRK
jgi:cell division GTPase FtsZ